MSFKVSIVGRPNVGKSSLFNRIVRHRRSLVMDYDGVTRDPISYEVNLFGRSVVVVDSGGLDLTKKISFHQEIADKIMEVIDDADLILLVVDGRVSVTVEDIAISRILLSKGKQVMVVANKIDSNEKCYVDEYYILGCLGVWDVSAIHGRGVADLLEEIGRKAGTDYLTKVSKSKVMVLGAPNAGKSTLVNSLIGRDRMLVSSVRGTTRDIVEMDMGEWILADTPGLSKKKKDLMEKLSEVRIKSFFGSADIILLVVDAILGLIDVDEKILRLVERFGRGCCIFFNKCDLVNGISESRVKRMWPGIRHYPLIFGSALKGNIDGVVENLGVVDRNFRRRVGTPVINRVLQRVVEGHTPPLVSGKQVALRYVTQVSTAPPRFVLFTNREVEMPENYMRYLKNQIIEKLGFTGIPIRISLKKCR